MQDIYIFPLEELQHIMFKLTKAIMGDIQFASELICTCISATYIKLSLYDEVTTFCFIYHNLVHIHDPLLSVSLYLTTLYRR